MKKMIKKVLAYILVIGELFQATGVYALTKEETVYAKLDEKGDIKNVSISEHLYDYKDNLIKDKSILKDIKNINGNEKFSKDGNDLLWETKGNDIYYKGMYEKELPIDVDVKYYLDGKELDVNDILGKKGKIKIELNYKNKAYKFININGTMEKIYVPYMIATTSILNNSDNKNIKVTNGKIIDNGLSSIVMAISSPGLYESLKIDKLKEIDKVVITYDTDYFELNSIYSVATTDMFDEKIDMFSDINNLYSSINLLQSNMNTIVEASRKLSDGSKQMNIGITELNNKVQELSKKYGYYRNQDINVLKEDVIKIIESNINMITPALEKDITNETSKIIKENKEELEKAVVSYTIKNSKEVINEEVGRVVSELDTEKIVGNIINSNLYNILKNDSEIEKLTYMLKKDISDKVNNIVINELNNINSSLENNMTDVKDNDVSFIIENYGLTEEQAKEIVNKVQSDTINQVNENVKQVAISDKIINDLNNSEEIYNLVNSYINELNNKLTEVLGKDTTTCEYAKEVKDKIILAIKKDIDENNIDLNNDIKLYINELMDKIIDNTAKEIASNVTTDYANKVVRNVINNSLNEDNVDSKIRELYDIYEDDIINKVTVLDDAVNGLTGALNKLNDGSNQMYNGMNSLSNGLDKYNKEGINKINNLVNGDVRNIQKRLDALMELSNNNKMIDNSPNGASKSSKVIFMIDAIAKPKENNNIEKHSAKTKSTIWDKIKGLFD